MNKWIADFGTV